jgi:membrane-bound lytic murein transglycosylase B
MWNWKSLLVSAAFIVSPVLYANPLLECYPEWQQKARALGLSEQITESIIPGLQHLPRVLELDRRQPEFTESFSNYFNTRVSEQRIERGRALLKEHAALLTRLTREYGVPGQYLIAFWGLETNYGSYKGKMSTLDSLATLACDPRRKDFFTTQLFDAFYLLQDHGIEPATMVGSWAGAVGHTQFMPGNYRRFAVDGDGDGKIDLWDSIPDALTSAANFLKNLGWQPRERWGREVRLPEHFPYQALVEKRKRPLKEWRELGLTTAQGAKLPVEDMQATLILPAGHTGPAFLAYDNFNVIMGWNRSEFYALSVGHLADRINGAGRLAVTPPEQPRLTIAQIQALQERLKELGFKEGEADGILGPATREAIRAYQKQHNLIPDGFPHPSLFKALNVSLDNPDKTETQ